MSDVRCTWPGHDLLLKLCKQHIAESKHIADGRQTADKQRNSWHGVPQKLYSSSSDQAAITPVDGCQMVLLTLLPHLLLVDICVAWSCRLAHAFTKPAFYDPLVALEDPLAGLHANTHLAQASDTCSSSHCSISCLHRPLLLLMNIVIPSPA